MFGVRALASTQTPGGYAVQLFRGRRKELGSFEAWDEERDMWLVSGTFSSDQHVATFSASVIILEPRAQMMSMLAQRILGEHDVAKALFAGGSGL